MELHPRIRRHNNGYFNAKLNHQDGHVFKDELQPQKNAQSDLRDAKATNSICRPWAGVT